MMKIIDLKSKSLRCGNKEQDLTDLDTMIQEINENPLFFEVLNVFKEKKSYQFLDFRETFLESENLNYARYNRLKKLDKNLAILIDDIAILIMFQVLKHITFLFLLNKDFANGLPPLKHFLQPDQKRKFTLPVFGTIHSRLRCFMPQTYLNLAKLYDFTPFEIDNSDDDFHDDIDMF